MHNFLKYAIKSLQAIQFSFNCLKLLFPKIPFEIYLTFRLHLPNINKDFGGNQTLTLVQNIPKLASNKHIDKLSQNKLKSMF